MKTRSVWFAILFAVTSNASFANETDADADTSAIELFNARIMPIFRSPKPSSCVQCHLAAVDLKNYIKPSHEETFISLRDQKLINVSVPKESKILKLIQMGEKDADKRAQLIHEQIRKAEFDAFVAWIEACCGDSDLVNRPAAEDFQPAAPVHSDVVIRHARKSRVLDSFERIVWSQRMRCFPCHTPHEIDPDNPQHQKPAERQRDLVKQFGQKVNLFQNTPEKTLQQWIVNSRIKSERHLPMLNLEDPRKSLLILKPTAKLPAKDDDGKFERPSSVEPISHMGGLKMHVNDQTYKALVSWIQDYANVVGNRYTSVDDLPADNWQPSLCVLRLQDCPESWPVGTPVQLFVHRWNNETDSWAPDAIAFTQGTVTPRRIVNGSLFTFATGTSTPQDATALKAGRYQVSVYVDQHHRIAADPTLMLDQRDVKGHVEVEAKWREGFKQAEMISFSEAVDQSELR